MKLWFGFPFVEKHGFSSNKEYFSSGIFIIIEDLLDTHRRPNRDLLETDNAWSETHLDTNMTDQWPTYLIGLDQHALLETVMPL